MSLSRDLNSFWEWTVTNTCDEFATFFDYEETGLLFYNMFYECQLTSHSASAEDQNQENQLNLDGEEFAVFISDEEFVRIMAEVNAGTAPIEYSD